MKILPFSRNHRTALVLDIRRGVDGEYEERVKRVLQSVNGANIKVDVFTLSGPDGGTLTQGTTIPSQATVQAKATEVTLSPGSPFATEKAAEVSAPADVIAELDGALAERGYVQVLHVRNLNALK